MWPKKVLLVGACQTNPSEKNMPSSNWIPFSQIKKTKSMRSNQHLGTNVFVGLFPFPPNQFVFWKPICPGLGPISLNKVLGMKSDWIVLLIYNHPLINISKNISTKYTVSTFLFCSNHFALHGRNNPIPHSFFLFAGCLRSIICTLIEKCMAQSRCIGLYEPFTNLPFWNG